MDYKSIFYCDVWVKIGIDQDREELIKELRIHVIDYALYTGGDNATIS